MKSIHDIRPQVPKLKKVRKAEPTYEPLDKQAFTLTIDQLSNRLNYAKDDLSRRQRFLHAVKKIKG